MLHKKITKLLLSTFTIATLCISGLTFGIWSNSNEKSTRATVDASTVTDVSWSQISSRGTVIHSTNYAGNWNIVLEPYKMYKFEVWGAQGGNGQTKGGAGGRGGYGSYALGWYDTRNNPSDVTITAFAGTHGGSSNLPGAPAAYSPSGGTTGGLSAGGTGGGASGIHIGSTPLIIAGGGGGGGGGGWCIKQESNSAFWSHGGNGGGATGGNGGYYKAKGSDGSHNYWGGYGATQSGNGANAKTDPGRVIDDFKGGSGGGGGGGYRRGYQGGRGLSDRHGTMGGRIHKLGGGGGSAGSFYTGGVQSISGSSVVTTWGAKAGSGQVIITEYIIEYPVVSPNSIADQFTTSEPSLEKVLPNGEFTFTMTLDASRTQASAPIITVNNASVEVGTKTYVDGNYVINYRVYDVTRPITAGDYTISNIPINQYSVNSPPDNINDGVGYTFTNQSLEIVEHWGSYTFTLELAESHRESSVIIRLLRNGTLTLTNPETWTYTVSNVTGPITEEDFEVDIPLSKYPVVFDPKGGKHAEGFNGIADSITYTDPIPKPEIPTLKGYTFHGWWESDDRGKTLSREWLFDTDVLMTATLTLYAKWIPYDFRLVYKNEGEDTFIGNYPGEIPTIHTYEIMPTRLWDPTRNGYTFGGWFLDGVQLDNGTISSLYFPTGAAHNKEITIYARWHVNTCYITYENVEDVEFDLDWFGEYPTEFTVESNPIILVEPVRYGWDFKGWYFDKEMTKPTVNIPTGTYVNTTVYAEWEEWEYEVSIQRHNPNLPNDIRIIKVYYTQLPYSLTDLGYADLEDWFFMGWAYLSSYTIDDSKIYEHDFVDTVEYGKTVRRTTVVAKWHAKIMEVTFRTLLAQGTFEGQENVERFTEYEQIKIEVKYDESIPFNIIPVSKMYNGTKGYYFSHWEYTGPDGELVYFNPITDRISTSVTLIAYWILNTDSVQSVMMVLDKTELSSPALGLDEIRLNALFDLMDKAEQMIDTGRVNGVQQTPSNVEAMRVNLVTALNALFNDPDLEAKIEKMAYIDQLLNDLYTLHEMTEYSEFQDDIYDMIMDINDFLKRPISSITLTEVEIMIETILDFFENRLGIEISENGRPDLPIVAPNPQLIYVLQQKIKELEKFEEPSENIRLTPELKFILSEKMAQARKLMVTLNKTDAEMETVLAQLSGVQSMIEAHILTLAYTDAQLTEALEAIISEMTEYYDDAGMWGMIGTNLKADLQTMLAIATATNKGIGDPLLTKVRADELIKQLNDMKVLIDAQIAIEEAAWQSSYEELNTLLTTIEVFLETMPEGTSKNHLKEAYIAAQSKLDSSSTKNELKEAKTTLETAYEKYKDGIGDEGKYPENPKTKIFIVIAVLIPLLILALFIVLMVMRKRKLKAVD